MSAGGLCFRRLLTAPNSGDVHLTSSRHRRVEAPRRRRLIPRSALAPCSRMSIVRFANGPKRSMGHVVGAKKGIFLIRGRGRPTVCGGRAGLILSIRGPEVSLGSPRVVLYMVSRLHRMRRRFEGLSANSLNTGAHKTMNYLAMASRALGGPQLRRMRYRRLPTTRPTPRDLQEPICVRKK